MYKAQRLIHYFNLQSGELARKKFLEGFLSFNNDFLGFR
jgi:hypothetical protein